MTGAASTETPSPCWSNTGTSKPSTSRRHRHTAAPDQDKLDLLQLLARTLQDSPHGLAGNRITEPDLRDVFETYLRAERGYPHPGPRIADGMITQLRTRNYILARYGPGVYGFVHRAFLEYLAAADITQRFDDRELIRRTTCSPSTPAAGPTPPGAKSYSC